MVEDLSSCCEALGSIPFTVLFCFVLVVVVVVV